MIFKMMIVVMLAEQNRQTLDAGHAEMI